MRSRSCYGGVGWQFDRDDQVAAQHRVQILHELFHRKHARALPLQDLVLELEDAFQSN